MQKEGEKSDARRSAVLTEHVREKSQITPKRKVPGRESSDEGGKSLTGKIEARPDETPMNEFKRRRKGKSLRADETGQTVSIT